MKDFYDIYYLAHTFNFDGRKLQEAMFETLQNRGTSYDSDTFESVVDLSSFDMMKIRWKVFLKKIKTPLLEFEDVLSLIELFLKPIFNAIVREQEFFGQWDCKGREWTINCNRNGAKIDGYPKK